MAIQSVSTSTQSGISISNVATVSTDTSDKTTISSDSEAAVYEKTGQTTTKSKRTYTKETVTLSDINKQVEMKMASLRTTVEILFNTQTVKTGQAQGLNYDQILEKYNGNLKDFYQNLKVDDATRLTAQQDISADGFWGVKQTSDRAIEFAKALSGGDPTKIDVVKKSIEDGYKAAEKAWGGELPEICKQTQEATLKGLDDWANAAKQTG